MNRTLKSRLLIGLLASLGILLLVGCTIVYGLQRELLYGDFDRRLHMAFQSVMPQVVAQSFLKKTTVEQPIPGLTSFMLRHAQDGTILAHYRADLLDPSLGDDLQIGEMVAVDFTFTDGRPARAVVSKRRIPPLPDGAMIPGLPSPPGTLIVCLADHTLNLHAALRTRALTIGLTGFIAMVCITATVVWVVHRALRPLQPLGQQIASLQIDELDNPIRIPGLPGEIVPVVDRLNELLRRLHESFHREKSFTTNAAHELLTPVAGIRSTLEVTLSRERTSTQYVQALETCLDVVTGLERLVDNLLELSRLDSGQFTPSLSTVELWCVAERQWNAVCEQAQERHLTLINRLPEDLRCQADATLMDRIMANLLGNASQYADRNGRIEVRGETSDGRVYIAVENPTSDLTPEDVTHLFECFWEKDSARSQTGLHLGLGLSLVQRYIEAMEGSIKAELDKNHRLTIKFELPA